MSENSAKGLNSISKVDRYVADFITECDETLETNLKCYVLFHDKSVDDLAKLQKSGNFEQLNLEKECITIPIENSLNDGDIEVHFKLKDLRNKTKSPKDLGFIKIKIEDLRVEQQS